MKAIILDRAATTGLFAMQKTLKKVEWCVVVWMNIRDLEAIVLNAVQMSRRHQELCPLDSTLGILSGKWKSIIICRLMHGPHRFSELQREIPGCTRRMLSLQLNQLAKDRIVSRHVDASAVPIRTTYKLTTLGQSLVPIIRRMDEWGSMYLSHVKRK